MGHHWGTTGGPLGDHWGTIGSHWGQFDEPLDEDQQSDTHVEAREPEVSRA